MLFLSSSYSPSLIAGIRFVSQLHPPPLKTRLLPDGALAGKTALVTGGGTGLGRGIAEMMAALGASVGIASRKMDIVQKAAEELSEKTSGKVAPFQLDVRDPTAVSRVANEFTNSLGSLPDIIINNAAGNFISPTERLSSNAFRTILDIVVMGTANVTLEFGKRLIAAKRGANFLAITATYTEHGSGFVVPSATAKAGVEAMTRSLASEWGRYGMRFNAIAPGPIETKGAFSRLDPTGHFIKRSIEQIPVGRLGEVEELANLSTYIVSDYASWLNGEIIAFDGGQLPFAAGMFNELTKVTPEQWDMLENTIRNAKGS